MLENKSVYVMHQITQITIILFLWSLLAQNVEAVRFFENSQDPDPDQALNSLGPQFRSSDKCCSSSRDCKSYEKCSDCNTCVKIWDAPKLLKCKYLQYKYHHQKSRQLIRPRGCRSEKDCCKSCGEICAYINPKTGIGYCKALKGCIGWAILMGK